MDVISKPITHGLAYRELRLCLGPGAGCGHRMHGGVILHCVGGIGPDATGPHTWGDLIVRRIAEYFIMYLGTAFTVGTVQEKI